MAGARARDRGDHVLRAAADRPALAGAVGRRVADTCRTRRLARRCGSRSCARCGRPAFRSCSGCRWRGCWRGCEFPGRAAVRALCTLSMVLPPVVGGVALFFALGRRGIVGQYLDRWFDIRLPFTTAGVVVAQTFVAMPFLVITVEAALRQLDARFEDASRTLGASSWYTFRRVTMPGDPARARRRCRAVVGAGARRVRGDDHVRRQLPGPHADDAARRLSRARDQPAGGDRARARADRDLVRGARRAARSLARWWRDVDGGRRRSRRDADGGDRGATSVHSICRSSSTSHPGRCWRCSDRTAPARRRVLRSLAGLVPIDAGRIVIDELVVDEPATDDVRRTRTSPDRPRVPGLPAVRPHDRARERRLRAARPQDAEGRRPPNGRASGSSGWG